MVVLYPSGYDGSDQDTRVDEFLPLDDLIAKKLAGGHPEFVRRVRALLVASGGLVGIGTGWRSASLQETVFVVRHEVVASGGCCSWNGKRWKLRPGMAHAAAPGLSFHEEHEWANGTIGCQAIDAVGHDDKGPYSHAVAWQWLKVNAARFGLQTAWNWSTAEPWHVQMIEIPRAVSTWKAEGRPNPQRWELPGTEPDNPSPPEVDPMANVAKIRLRGYADQFALIPLGPDTNIRLGLGTQAPIIVDGNPNEIERDAGYKLTPTKDGR